MLFPEGLLLQNLLLCYGFYVRSDLQSGSMCTLGERWPMSKNTGIVKDWRYLRHGSEFSHPESPQRLVSIYEMLDNPDMVWKFIGIDAREASRAELERVHRPAYIDTIAATAGQSMFMLDPDTVATPETYEIARLAAGGVMNAIDTRDIPGSGQRLCPDPPAGPSCPGRGRRRVSASLTILRSVRGTPWPCTGWSVS